MKESELPELVTALNRLARGTHVAMGHRLGSPFKAVQVRGFVETTQWAAASGHQLRGLSTDNSKAMDSKRMASKDMVSKGIQPKATPSRAINSKDTHQATNRGILNKATNNKVA
ncbi:hypothetical protein WJX79_000735 [Trebouxia sp. C0005]